MQKGQLVMRLQERKEVPPDVEYRVVARKFARVETKNG